jgi:hypothetical protein
MGGHRPRHCPQRPEWSKIDLFQFRSRCPDNRHAEVAVNQGSAVTGNMLDHRKNTSSEQPVAPSPPEQRRALRSIARGAIANHLMSTRVRHIQNRRAIDRNPQVRKLSGQHPGVQPRRFPCLRFVCSREYGKPRGGRRGPPVGRPQTGNASTFLIDQNRSVVATDSLPEVRDKRPHLRGLDAVAGEENEAKRVGRCEQGTLGGRKRRSAEAEDHGSRLMFGYANHLMLHDDTGDLAVDERGAQLPRRCLARDRARLKPVEHSALSEIGFDNLRPEAA